MATDHRDDSYRLARAIVGDRGEAEDAVHDAFERAWRKWSSLRDPERFEASFGGSWSTAVATGCARRRGGR